MSCGAGGEQLGERAGGHAGAQLVGVAGGVEEPDGGLVAVDGIIVDARSLPAELQDEARRRGLIPDLGRRAA